MTILCRAKSHAADPKDLAEALESNLRDYFGSKVIQFMVVCARAATCQVDFAQHVDQHEVCLVVESTGFLIDPMHTLVS